MQSRPLDITVNKSDTITMPKTGFQKKKKKKRKCHARKDGE